MEKLISNHLLTLIVFSPLAGAIVIALLPRKAHGLIRHAALAVSLVTFALTVQLWRVFDPAIGGMQLVTNIPWIKRFGIGYNIGVDGISLLLIVLTGFLTAIAVLSSYNYIQKRVKEYFVFLLLLQVGMLGVFVSIDMFLFYLFWEAMLIPMYFLIGVWGGERRIYATIKFVLYTMAGSVFMLIAIIIMYFMHIDQFGTASFNLFDFYKLDIPIQSARWLFVTFAVAFAIKVPLFPFHTWLPDAHVEAPTAGSVILAGVLLKMGTYGYLRFALPLFPEAALHFSPVIVTLAVISIIYGALVAMVQVDIKKLVAYSSMSHLGYCMLGMFAFNIQGMEGSLLQMINHGLSTGALFLIVGMLYERRHTRLIAAYGGVARVMPAFFVCFLIATLSSIGLPGLNGFIGEFLILLGSFQTNLVPTIFAATGVIFAAIYMLWMFQRVMYGETDKPENKKLKDLSLREFFVLIPIIIACFVIGIYSKPFLRTMDASVIELLKRVDSKTHALKIDSMPSAQPEHHAAPAKHE